jgi:hypothetical protein
MRGWTRMTVCTGSHPVQVNLYILIFFTVIPARLSHSGPISQSGNGSLWDLARNLCSFLLDKTPLLLLSYQK